ncbi:hypothetical protein D3C78_1473440 [compost metagenome]
MRKVQFQQSQDMSSSEYLMPKWLTCTNICCSHVNTMKEAYCFSGLGKSIFTFLASAKRLHRLPQPLRWTVSGTIFYLTIVTMVLF